MLNSPLSLLSDELLDSIVEHVAVCEQAYGLKILYNLSLADRAFTQSCQKYIFRSFVLRNTISEKRLKRAKKILNDKPSLANQVRTVRLDISSDESAWLFNDPTFISVIQLLAKSPVPPHDLFFGGHSFTSFIIEDPILVVRWLAQSFFSQTLTFLRLTQCKNVPLPIFLICPRLREVSLNHAGATEKSYDKYPDNQCSGREPPSLEVLDYRDSHSLVEQMIAPPSRFNTPVVLWSNLRILTITPHEKEGMACLQPIIDAACNTLEELYLTNIHVGESKQLPLAGLVNLSNASRLHVFSLYAFIKCKAPHKAPRFAVLRDINIVFGTIPESNKVTNLSFDFEINGRRPFRGCLDEDWVGMFNEVIRISGGKPLEVELKMSIDNYDFELRYPGDDELYMYIMDKAGSLSDYPEICTHFWNPTYEFPPPIDRGQVRSRCRR